MPNFDIIRAVNLKDILHKNIYTVLFCSFFFLYLSLGLFIVYYSGVITDLNFDLVHSIDSGAAYWQLYLNDHIAARKHPLIHVFLNPIIFMLKEFFRDPKLLEIVLQSLLQSTVICFVYKILFKLTNRMSLSLLFSLVYGFSYTAILFAIFPDVYAFAATGQILFFSYFIYCYFNAKNKLDFKNFLVLVFLSVMGYGINLINIASCGIFIIFLLFKYYNRQYKKIFIEVLKFASIIAVLILILFQLQNFTFSIQGRTSGVGHVRLGYTEGKISEVIKGTYIEPLYALKSGQSQELNEYEKHDGSVVYLPRYITLENQSFARCFPALIFFLFPFVFYLKNYKKYKNRAIINLLLSIVALYTLFNYSFYSEECALFALNFFPFFVILLGLIYEHIKPLVVNCLVGIFLIYAVFLNVFNLFDIHKFLLNYDAAGHSFLFCVLIAAIFVCACCFVFVLLKKIYDKNQFFKSVKDPYLHWVLMYASIITIFIASRCLYRIVS